MVYLALVSYLAIQRLGSEHWVFRISVNVHVHLIICITITACAGKCGTKIIYKHCTLVFVHLAGLNILKSIDLINSITSLFFQNLVSPQNMILQEEEKKLPYFYFNVFWLIIVLPWKTR